MAVVMLIIDPQPSSSSPPQALADIQIGRGLHQSPNIRMGAVCTNDSSRGASVSNVLFYAALFSI